MARESEPFWKRAEEGDQSDQTGQEATPENTSGTAEGAGSEGSGDDAFGKLREHHKTLRALLGECEGTRDPGEADDVMQRLAGEWARHAEAHGVLYDAAVEAGLEEFPLLTEIAIETDLISFLLHRGTRLDGALQLAALRIAARLIGGIIEREEKPRSGLFTKAKAAGVDPAALGGDISARLTAPSGRGGEFMPRLRHLENQENIMPRTSSTPERDDRGRFVSDHDYGGRGRSSGRYDDDRDRDSRGRFTSDRDDDRGRSRSDDGRYSRSSGGYDDDRDLQSRGRSTSQRDDGRGRSRSDDGRCARSSGGYDDDRDRDSRGRFTSDRDGGRGWSRDDDGRYAQSSRRYDDDDRSSSRGRGQGGWFGDSEGHAEAARRGWDNRRDDDDGRYARRDDDGRYGSSRSRYDDDRGRSQGQGWFGDSEGHAEAARRGWDHRRDDDDRGYGRGRR